MTHTSRREMLPRTSVAVVCLCATLCVLADAAALADAAGGGQVVVMTDEMMHRDLFEV